ncbi:hypothetical protein JWH11_11070 [Xanthomonas melonis]|uniref:Uncharacterized protein n=2 Tax=Xanthomonas melonis TaxID=56456 RepID=A0ABS8NV64_9XANT|nr:hypothetical protein [Xanthomonas melonis]
MKAFAAALLIVGLPIYLCLFSGLIAVPEWAKLVAVLGGVPAIIGIRALSMERLADALVYYQ